MYPNIEVGDYVRLYRKKINLIKKEYQFGAKTYKVLEITESMGQQLFTVDKKEYGREPTYIRSEILLVNTKNAIIIQNYCII